ncbi:MAG: hypothetical protein E7588_04330 [Ruminococcaceae bacterium]|nr:hypothetical protein [Oscillospiraceae bacterium]
MMILKIIIIAITLAVLCLPFFPAKFRFSLASCGYDKKDRYRNVIFVLETLVVSCVLLCVAPLLKNVFDWFFGLGFMKWLVNLFPDRLVYAVDVFVLLITNIAVCVLFILAKKFSRKILDEKVFKNSSSGADNKKKDKKKNTAGSDSKDRSEKRLKLLRRESILVFSRITKSKKSLSRKVEDYKFTDKDEEFEHEEQIAKDENETLSLKELAIKMWFKFLGIFYDAKEEYRYVKTGTYRWAKELKIFIALVCAVYLAVCVVILLPVYFSFAKFPGFYSVASWLVSNTYMYPMLSLVFLFELLWFIDGEHKKPEEAEAPFVSYADGVREEKKTDLVKVRNALLDKYSGSYAIKNFDTDATAGKSTYNIGEKKQAIQNMAKAIRMNKGTVNGDYMQSIEYMFEGKHVLFDSSLYSALGEYIIHYLFVKLSFGTRVLFICKDKKEIENAVSYLRDSFRRLTGTSQILWRISTFEKLHEGERPDILLLTPEEFLERSLYVDGRSFFEELEDVFVLDADKILTANNYYCLIMAKRLEKATTVISAGQADSQLAVSTEKRIRYSFFSNGYIQALGNSIRQFFNLENAPLEAFHSFGLASKNEVYIWHTGVSSTLYVDNGANQVALEVQIAKDACNLGIKNINLISDTTVYSSQLNEINGLTLNHCDLSDNPVGYVIVADDCFNLPNAIYSYSRFAGRKASVLHVVSKPYLLRDYFTARAEDYVSRFELIGKTMCEHAAAKKANIIILLCDAVNGIEQTAFVDRAVELLGDMLDAEDTCDGKKPSLDKCVELCYKVAFGEGYDEPRYSLRKKQNSELETKNFVYIRNSGRIFEKLLEKTRTVKLEYVNTQSVEYLPVFKDEIVQHFIPGQILVRNNHAYTIKSVDVNEGTLVLDDTGASVNIPMDYIQTRRYRVSKADVVSGFGHDYRAKNSIVSHVGFTVYDADISVETVGYYSIEKAVQNVDLVKPNFAKYVNLGESHGLAPILTRDINTRMLEVELEVSQPVTSDITYSLAVILHEFMKTVFPDQYRCISVCPVFEEGEQDTFFEQDTAVRDLYPVFTSYIKDEKADTDEKGGRIRFAVIEDIRGGNGVVETLVDGNGIMVTNILHVAADFLAWAVTNKDYKYLNFGYDKRPEVFNLEKLEEIIRQFRHEVEHSELVRIHEGNTCFFCHKTLDSEQGFTLEDGRVICSSCKDSSVDTFEALEGVFAEVLNTIINSTSVADTFPKNISVDFVSTGELRRRYGEDAENLPVAYCNHVTGCIYVEYGLPKPTVCGVIARMITELWQDRNVVSDGDEKFFAHPYYVELQTISAMRFGNESELLYAFYEGKKGLVALNKALSEAGTSDSFAYFMGVTGKDDGTGNKTDEDEKHGGTDEGKKDDKKDSTDDKKGEHNDGKDEEKNSDDDNKEEDTVFIADRDPKTLPRFWYNRLNGDEKTVYDEVYKALSERAEKAGPFSVDVGGEACCNIVKMVLDDNPDIFWCANSPGIVTGDGKNVVFNYVMSASEIKRRKKQIEKAIKPFLKGIKPSMSDYEVALRTHENIVELIDYDSLELDAQEKDSEFDKKPDNIRTIYGVFVEGEAVCAGYAKAFQYLLNRLGIECAYVIGTCNEGGGHAWNLVKLEGEYYYIDVTFDDHSNTDIRKNVSGNVSYDYFCITTEELARSRKTRKAECYPQCTATKCNYFVRNKLVFKEYDASRISKLIISAINSGKKEVALKAQSPAVLSVMSNRLIKGQGVFDIMRSPEVTKPLSSYLHYINEDLNILHIVFEK